LIGKLTLVVIFVVSFSALIGTAFADSLISSTFVGDSDFDRARGVVLDSSKNVYVTGLTRSDNFPTTVGAYDTSHNGNFDVFVIKLSPDLSTLLAATYIGGSGIDEAHGIAIDNLGRIYVTGFTQDSITDFPTTTGAYDENHNGGTDVFVLRLDADLTDLQASTLIGGSGDEEGRGIAIDSTGRVFVTGYTDDSTTDYPTTSGAYDENHNGGFDALVSRLDADLTDLQTSTLLGGSGGEFSRDIEIDNADRIYVTGETANGVTDHPTTAGAYDESQNGNLDVFVSKLSNDLSSLMASTFIGGSSTDKGISLVFDSSGDLFVSCICFSNNYPTTTGAFMEINPGGSASIAISKLSNNLQDLKSSTFIGGNGLDNEPRLLSDLSNNIILTGFTTSNNYPTTSGAFQENYIGGPGADDAIISKLNNELDTLIASTFIAGNSGDAGLRAVLDGMGRLYMVGSTTSSDFPTTVGAYDTDFNDESECFDSGGAAPCSDAFVLLFSFDPIDLLIGGEIIPIETTALLLAGTQLTASWLIPVIIAGAGIVLVFVRKSENS